MRLLFILIVLMTTTAMSAQDVHFSRFYEVPVYQNPALAGLFEGDIRISTTYRDQWNSFVNAYRTTALSIEYKVPVGNSYNFLTLGTQMLYDKAGTAGFTHTSVLPSLTFHKSISAQKIAYLSLGLTGGMVHRAIDQARITTNNQYDGNFNPSLPDGETGLYNGFSYPDGGIGISLNKEFGTGYQNLFYIGMAMHHLNHPKNSFFKNASIEVYPRYVFSMGTKLNVDDYTYFTILSDRTQQGPYRETTAGIIYSKKLVTDPDDNSYLLHFGTMLRWQDALIPVLKIDKNSLAFSLSYDINISPLKSASASRGGFELSIVYKGFLNKSNSTLDQVLCPRF